MWGARRPASLRRPWCCGQPRWRAGPPTAARSRPCRRRLAEACQLPRFRAASCRPAHHGAAVAGANVRGDCPAWTATDRLQKKSDMHPPRLHASDCHAELWFASASAHLGLRPLGGHLGELALEEREHLGPVAHRAEHERAAVQHGPLVELARKARDLLWQLLLLFLGADGPLQQPVCVAALHARPRCLARRRRQVLRPNERYHRRTIINATRAAKRTRLLNKFSCWC